MISVAKRNKAMTGWTVQLPILACDSHGHFHSRGTVIGIKNAAERAARKQFHDCFPQLDCGRVCKTEKGGVRDAIKLLSDGGIDVGMVMPMNVGPDRRIAVDVFAAAAVSKQ